MRVPKELLNLLRPTALTMRQIPVRGGMNRMLGSNPNSGRLLTKDPVMRVPGPGPVPGRGTGSLDQALSGVAPQLDDVEPRRKNLMAPSFGGFLKRS